MDAEQFRQNGHQLVDWMANYLDGVAGFPVSPNTKPGEVKAALPEAAPEESESIDEIVNDFVNQIVPHMTHWNHPSFFAYFPMDCWSGLER